MSAWSLETGPYMLGVAVAALFPRVCLLLVCWRLWDNRSKGRPCCPKCWYDMRGTVPGVVSTEGTRTRSKALVLSAVQRYHEC